MNTQEILAIIKDPSLTYHQRVLELAKAAENTPEPVAVSPETQWFVDRDIVFDMGEGNAPYRPRYVVPDYGKFLQQGSEFLMLPPPKTIRQAVDSLLILYHHVPSTTGEPVYIGHLDRLLEPFVQDEEEAREAIRALLTHVDRTISDSFCHCNLGPHDTKAGRIILELTAEMQRPVPNMSFIYDKDITPDDLAIKAIETGLLASKPSFANNTVYAADWGQDYAIASCYNALPLGGGGLTLGRLNMKNLAEQAQSPQQFMDDLLPRAVAAQCEQMDKRDNYIIDEAKFFEYSFLAKEGLIAPERFVGMFGLVGMANCVNTLLNLTKPEERYGHGEAANQFAEQILEKMDKQVRAFTPKHGKFYLHGQVGISIDTGITPNVRVPVGEEPALPQHLSITARLQKHFACGVGELFPFEPTVKRNPASVLDIIKGAFAQGLRYFSFYSSDSDVIRVTGYLVKRSDIEKLDAGEMVLATTTKFGSGATRGLNVFGRKVRNGSNE